MTRVAVAGAAAVALLATAVVAGATAPPAGALDTVESGWWWREQPADGALPPPPQVPDGGLRVASDATGPSAVAAIRVSLGQGERNPVVTLKVAAGSIQGVVLTACPAASTWKPVSGGAWSSRPEPDCASGAVAGSPSADGKTVTFDLSSLPTADVVVSVATQPLPADPSPLPAPRESSPTADVSFAKPSPADVAVVADPTGDALPESPPAPAPVEGDTAPLDLGATPSFDAAPLPAIEPNTAAPAATAAPAPRTGAPLATLGTPAVRPAVRPVARLFDPVDEKRDRMLAAFVFVDLLAGWWLLERRRPTAATADVPPLR